MNLCRRKAAVPQPADDDTPRRPTLTDGKKKKKKKKRNLGLLSFGEEAGAELAEAKNTGTPFIASGLLWVCCNEKKKMAAGRTGIKSTHDAAIDPRLRPEAAYVCACCRCNSTPRLSVVVCTTRLDRHPCLRACARYDGPSKPVPDGGTASGTQSRPSTKVNKDQQAKAFAEAMRQRIHSRSGAPSVLIGY